MGHPGSLRALRSERNFPSSLSKYDLNTGLPTTQHPDKRLPFASGIFAGGDVRIVGAQEKNQIRITPSLHSEKKKTYTTTTERKSFEELFWPQRKTFQAGVVDTKTLLKKPGKPYPPPKSFLCGPHFFLQRKVLHWSRAVYAFFFPSLHW